MVGYVCQNGHEVIPGIHFHFWIELANLLLHLLLYHLHNTFARNVTGREISDIQIDDGIFVKMLLKRRMTGNLQVSEERA